MSTLKYTQSLERERLSRVRERQENSSMLGRDTLEPVRLPVLLPKMAGVIGLDTRDELLSALMYLPNEAHREHQMQLIGFRQQLQFTKVSTIMPRLFIAHPSFTANC